MPDPLERIGWVLIHSLWQETLLGVIAWLGCLVLRRSPAFLRYNFLCACLLLCGLVPAFTWGWLGASTPWHQSPLTAIFHGTIMSAFESAASLNEKLAGCTSFLKFAAPSFNYIRLNLLLEQGLRFVAAIWCIFVLMLCFRTYRDYRALLKLVSSGMPISKQRTPDIQFVTRLSELASQMGIHRTELLMESALTEVPSVVGFFRPIILVPLAFLGSMPPDQVEAILVHELAHLRRYDNFFNLVQSIVETLLFYHPSVRWISGVIREERENCCDDLALAAGYESKRYASALATLAERSLIPNTIVMAADGGLLLRRVRRMLGKDSAGLTVARELYVGMLLVVTIIGVCSAISFTVKQASVVKHLDQLYLTKALVSAAGNGDIQLMESLIRDGAEIARNVEPTDQNALFAAATRNQKDAVMLLLQKGAPIDVRSKWGMTAMDWALSTGNSPLATLLHDQGAKISRGQWAAAIDDASGFKSFLSSNLADQDQDGLMKTAVSMGHLDIVHLLEKRMGKPVGGTHLVDAASADNLPMMAYILSQGANIHTDGENALEQVVVIYDRPKAARFLIQQGADPNLFTRWEKYLLSGAQNASMVRVLVEGGANPNSQDQWGTPLSAAPDVESIRLLVGHGADLHPKLKNGLSLVESAVAHDRFDRPDVIKELIRQGASFDPRGNGVGALAFAASHNKVKTMLCLLDMGVSPNAYFDARFWHTSEMRSAVFGSSFDGVKLLLEQGGIAGGDKRDNVPPSLLALLLRESDVAMLLRKGGARNVSDLSLDASRGEYNEVDYLIKHGADINQKDQAGNTPLFYALRFDQTNIVHLLVQHGAVMPQENVSLNNL